MLPAALVLITLVVAVVGSVGAPLITQVAAAYGVPLATAQWTLTITLLTGAVATPVLGRLGSGAMRRPVIVGALAVALCGSVLTVVPLGFAGLLLGRAAQGIALGITAPLMAVARDHFAPERARAIITQISVAATFGIGVGYPLAGWLTDLGGVHLAYLCALFAITSALVLALVVMPPSPRSEPARLDVLGTMLLAAGLGALLISAGTTALWRSNPAMGGATIAVASALLLWWRSHERRTADPLVDLRTIGTPALILANLITFVGGMGAYLLQTLITRYVQTPPAAGYGVGGSTLIAGLILLPFAASGVVGGWLAHRGARITGHRAILGSSAAVMWLGFAVFALDHARLADSFIAIAVLGAGAGGFNAAMPSVILRTIRPADTASVMSVNQLVRTVGFSCGSALGGFMLATMTPSTAMFPAQSAYSATAWIGAAIMVLTAVLCLGPNRG